jgi:hypothetical protein
MDFDKIFTYEASEDYRAPGEKKESEFSLSFLISMITGNEKPLSLQIPSAEV